MQVADPTVPCPACKRAMTWSRELAGCTVQCPCGRAFAMPFNNPAEEDVYDLGEPVAPAKPKHVARAPVGPQPVERVLAYQPHFEKPSKVAAIKEAMSDTTLSELTIPIAMIAIGIVARLAVVFLKPSAQGVPMALGIMVGAVALSALTMFIGVGIVAKFMGSDLGSLPVAAAKLLLPTKTSRNGFVWSAAPSGQRPSIATASTAAPRGASDPVGSAAAVACDTGRK